MELKLKKRKVTKMKITKSLKGLLFLGVIFALLLAVISGCDLGDGITIPSGASEMTISVKADDNVNDNPVSLVITEAKALIKEVELEMENGVDRDLKLEPFVINFTLNGSLKEALTNFTVRDKYTKIKFQIHKPEDNETPPDPEFKEGPSGNQRFSFIIKGIYNGNNFVYKSKKSANVVISFNKVENFNISKSNITVLFNKLKWFRNGSTEINPNDQQFENLIDDNIKNSFLRAFRDDDKNGMPDDN